MLSQRNLVSNAQALLKLWRFTTSDVHLHALPIYHTHGLFVALHVAFFCGSASLFLARFDVDNVIKRLAASTSMMGVPTFYVRLLEDQRICKKLVEHIRVFISGSAPLLPETHRQWVERTGHQILERYGMTETSMITSNPYENGRRVPGSVGLAIPGVFVRVVDRDTRSDANVGEIGLIEVSGPNVFKGYWRRPETTSEQFRPDGFFITGDEGHLDEDGYLYITGRSSELIISGGLNIYPREVELALNSIEGVEESAVFGVPNQNFGEAVFAVYVATTGQTPTIEFIRSQLSTCLAPFKRPKFIECADELPRNAMGKVLKRELKARYASIIAGAR